MKIRSPICAYMNHHNQAVHNHPPGRVVSSCLLYGAVSMALALAMHLSGMFEQGDARLKQALSVLTSDVFLIVVSDRLLFALGALCSFGIAFAMLDSSAAWRRIVLGLTALVVLLAMVPVCALWQIYFSPFFVVVAFFWSWFCTMMYTSQHIMPCERHDDVQGQSPIHSACSEQSLSDARVKPKEEVEDDFARSSDFSDTKYKPKD
mgnify:CR=1 FL=1|jgi:hypothetical protein